MEPQRVDTKTRNKIFQWWNPLPMVTKKRLAKEYYPHLQGTLVFISVGRIMEIWKGENDINDEEE